MSILDHPVTYSNQEGWQRMAATMVTVRRLYTSRKQALRAAKACEDLALRWKIDGTESSGYIVQFEVEQEDFQGE